MIGVGEGDCLPLLGRPGHCSSCSLVEWGGAWRGSLVVTLVYSPVGAGYQRELLVRARCGRARAGGLGRIWCSESAATSSSSGRSAWRFLSYMPAAGCREELPHPWGDGAIVRQRWTSVTLKTWSRPCQDSRKVIGSGMVAGVAFPRLKEDNRNPPGGTAGTPSLSRGRSSMAAAAESQPKRMAWARAGLGGPWYRGISQRGWC